MGKAEITVTLLCMGVIGMMVFGATTCEIKRACYMYAENEELCR